jgi:hypothetical protein
MLAAPSSNGKYKENNCFLRDGAFVFAISGNKKIMGKTGAMAIG